MDDYSLILHEWCNEESIAELADEKSLPRGIQYRHQNKVQSLIEAPKGRITARVEGTETYNVELQADEEGFTYSCNCPVGFTGAFCKHCVAVALTYSQGSVDPPRVEPKTTQRNDIKTWLMEQPREFLVDLLVGLAAQDDDLRMTFELRIAQTRGNPVDIGPIKHMITQATSIRRFISYQDMPGVARKVQHAVEAIYQLLKAGFYEEPIELTEYALKRVENLIESSDDSDGMLGSELIRLQQLHLYACQQTMPNPIKLAKTLFEWEINGPFDVFRGAVESYASVLGEAGVAEYRRLAEKAWEKVPALGPGDHEQKYESRRFAITSMMVSLGQVSGDVDKMVQVLSRDLSHPIDYLKIAVVCKSGNRDDEALSWAENGWAAFPNNRDTRLADLLSQEYNARCRYDEAMAVAWEQFTSRQWAGDYQALKRHADCSGSWPEWRAKALQKIRESVRDNKSSLVEFFLWEGDSDTAWAESRVGICNRDVWLKLAAARENTHPEQAIQVYKKTVEMVLVKTGESHYREAIRLLERMHPK